MPKDIRWVDWSYLSGLPRGLRFDEDTGTFTGTPREEGEYIVPIRVETNYGVDTKTVKIVVEGHTYPVYAIGAKAAQWSGGAAPDSEGFYPLPMPEAYKLLEHTGGFGAKTADGKYYCCGITSVINKPQPSDMSESLLSTATPQELNITDYAGANHTENIDEVQIVSLRNYTYTQSFGKKHSFLYEGYCMLVRFGGTKLYTEQSPVRLYQVNETNSTRNTSWYKSNKMIVTNSKAYKLGEAYAPLMYLTKPGLQDNICLWLGDDGHKALTIDGLATELEYNAIKMFLPYEEETAGSNQGYCRSQKAIYSYLSEDRHLDNDPSNFTIGVIRDAWVYKTKACVVTENGNVYEKLGASGSWSLQGNYDVKKLLMPNTKLTFMLTKDGKLYHKGAEVNGITSAHESFTRIYPLSKIHSMTYNSGTLTVIKE